MIRLAWKNIWYRPLNLILSLILFALGIGLITFLLLLNTQVKEQFDRNLADVDLVIGAKGSPLQLILCNMYHIDNPTGNITVKEAKTFMRPGHPLIKEAIPLSLGDSYRTYRIVGTTPDILPFYQASIKDGKIWERSREVCIGAGVAQATGLNIGDEFYSAHGFEDEDDFAHDHASLKVVGILSKTGSVIDQLILTPFNTVWEVHDHSEEEHEHEDENNHEHEGHEHHDHEHHEHEGHEHHEHDHNHEDGAHVHAESHVHEHAHDLSINDLLSHEEEEITSVLLRYKSKTNFQSLNLARNINENTDLQAASPAIEINRLYSMMGTGTQMLRWLAILIAIVSAISVFISLFKSMRERRYELALMRVMGGSKGALFSLILIEGIILALLGCLFGFLLSHISMEILAAYLKDDFRYSLTGWRWLPEEFWVFVASLILGAIAAFIPALQASRTDINKTLSQKRK